MLRHHLTSRNPFTQHPGAGSSTATAVVITPLGQARVHMLANRRSTDEWRIMDDLCADKVPWSQAVPEAESDPTFHTSVGFGLFLISQSSSLVLVRNYLILP